MLIYLYDLKIRDKKARNTVKRRFYYHLAKKFSNKFKRYTKSAVMLNEEYEKEIEEFFMNFQGFIEVYKIKTQMLERILEVTPISPNQ